MDHIALGTQGSFTFKDYVFHLLSAAGAGAFYFGAKRFGVPRFLPTITLIINNDNPLDDKDHPSVRTPATHLKLKAPDISDFDGDKLHWLAWKTNSLAAFTSTGFEAILKEGADVTSTPTLVNLNSIVYAKLVYATRNGSVLWIVEQHKATLNGSLAWRNLVDWFEGELVKNQLATTLRNKVHSSCLIPGVSASTYINQFMLNYHKLQDMGSMAMSEQEAKTLFLENITDNDYSGLREFLSTSIDSRTLREIVHELQQKELTLERQISMRKRTRRAAQMYGLIEPKPRRVRRNGTQTSSDGPKIQLPPDIAPNLNGFIYVDTPTWKKLEESHRHFILDYNKSVRHSDPLPEPPEGVTVGPKTDDGRGNTDIHGDKRPAKKVRRAPPPRDNDSDYSNPPSLPTQETRRVVFNVGNDFEQQTPRRVHVSEPYFPSHTTPCDHVTVKQEDVSVHSTQSFNSMSVDYDYSTDTPPCDHFNVKQEDVSITSTQSFLSIFTECADQTTTEFTNFDHVLADTSSNSMDTTTPADQGHYLSDREVPEAYRPPPNPYHLTEGRYGIVQRTSNLNKNTVSLYSSSCPRRLNLVHKTRRNKPSQVHRFVCDTGGGNRPTIHEAAWEICGGQPGLTTTLSPYQSKETFEHPVVSAVTKAEVSNLTAPVLFKVNYATFISTKHDPQERESLLTTWDISSYGVTVEGIHPNNDRCGLTVNGVFMEFDWDDESIFFSISKPTQAEMDTYEVYELNSPLPNHMGRKRRLPPQTWDTSFKTLPMGELRKRFAYTPETVINKTLDNTTQFYLETTEENQDNPRKHFRKRFKAIPDNRQHEEVATDFIYYSRKTSQGHIGGQIFSGVTSKRWEFFPLHKESQNSGALQDYIRKVGPPMTIVSDNAKSQIGQVWTQILRNYMIKTRTSEPHHPHQNPAESEWGRLGNMVKNVLRQSRAPRELCHWATIYCCQINNHVSRRSLGFRTPMEVSTGHTPDISKFRFHFYEPLWFFEPKMKLPKSNLLKCRYLAIAESCGDAMTYFILTEPDESNVRRQVLMRSVVKTRRKNIGTSSEYVNENPDMESFTLSIADKLKNNKQVLEHDSTEVPLLVPGEKISEGNNPDINTDDEVQQEEEASDTLRDTLDKDEEEQLHSEINSTNDAESHQPIVEITNQDLDDNFTFRKILDHAFIDGKLTMKAQYTDSTRGTYEIDTPFMKLKDDEPLACAKFIREYIPEKRRGDRPFNDWADKTIKQNTQTIRRMLNINPNWNPPQENSNTILAREILQHKLRNKIRMMRIRRNGPSRNQLWLEKQNKEKFGIKIPNTTKEALRMDAEAGNKKWYEAIKKEMDNLDRLKVFKYHSPDTEFTKEEGWQKAPLRMIYDVKNEDQRYKARLVCGGHKVDATGYNTYSSQVDGISILLLFTIAQHIGLDIMTCDVSNAFVTAPNSEKVWAIAGDEFGEKKGSKVEIQRALYGLPGSARAFSDFLADTLIRLGFKPSRADPDLWIKQTPYGYDYIATHVDDIIIASKCPQDYVALIEQEYALRNIEPDPSYYLGSRLKRRPDGKLQMNMEEYCKEMIRKYESKHNTCLKKETIPMPTDAKPEIDTTDLLNETDHKDFQHIIGMGQWLVIRGRIDITYAVSSLSRFSTSPRQGHLKLARKILGYLKKYPKKGILINPEPPTFSDYKDTPDENFEDFSHQYKYFHEEKDPRFPDQTIPELKVTIFCDADHAHDLVTGRSITGILAFVGSTPVYWKSTRQTSVQTSTFGSEFTALKKAVEVAVTIRYYLRSMGVKVEEATKIFVDNKSVFLNATNPASSLNKKPIALAYHYVREHQAGGVIKSYHIRSGDNYSDCLTKALNSSLHRGLVYEFMTN